MVSRDPPLGSSEPGKPQDENKEKFVLRHGFSEGVTDEQALRIEESQKDIRIEHAIFEDSVQKMSLVLSTAGNSKPKGLMIIGDSDSGKSTLLKAFRNKLERDEGKFYGGRKDVCDGSKTPWEHHSLKPAFMFSIPSGATANGILERALTLNGIVVSGRQTLTQLENLLYKKLRLMKTRVILIDEFQDVAHIGYRQQQDILKVIKEMTNNLSIPIIAAGTRDVESILISDNQIYTRFRQIHIQTFEVDENFKDFLTLYAEQRIHLRNKVDFEDEKNIKLVEEIHARADGLVGQVTQLLSMAVKHAILTGEEKITVETLNKIHFVPLSVALEGEKQKSKAKQRKDMGLE